MSMTTFSKDCDFSMELQASFEGSLQKDSISSTVRSVPHQTHSKKMESNKVIFHYLIRQLKTYKPLQIMVLVQLSFPPNLTHPWQVLEGNSSKAALRWIAINLFQIRGYLYQTCSFTWCKATLTAKESLPVTSHFHLCSSSHITTKHCVCPNTWHRLNRITISEKPSSALLPKGPTTSE